MDPLNHILIDTIFGSIFILSLMCLFLVQQRRAIEQRCEMGEIDTETHLTALRRQFEVSNGNASDKTVYLGTQLYVPIFDFSFVRNYSLANGNHPVSLHIDMRPFYNDASHASPRQPRRQKR